MERAGPSTSPQSIPFAPSAPAVDSQFGLIYADSSNPPAAFAVTTGGANQVEAGGTTLDLASISEYFPSGTGTATAWGTRYRVYAKTVGSDASLFAVDLRKSSNANPVAVRVSSSTVVGLQLCGNTPIGAFNDFHTASQSWIVFHVVGPDGNCGTPDDKYAAVQPSMSSATPAKALGQLEPVEAIYDTNGTITGYAAISHPPAPAPYITPAYPPPLQLLDATLTSTKQLATALTGNGLNTPSSGDFLSLGVSAPGVSPMVWLYFDNGHIDAVDLTSGVTTSLLTLASGDTVTGRAVFDTNGTTAYVAVNNASSGAYIVQVDTTSKTVTATQSRDPSATANVNLVGVTSLNLVYVLQDGSAVKSVVKSSLTGTMILNGTLTAGQAIDGLMAPGVKAGPSGTPTAFLVGDTVYFTVADATATASTGSAKQAYFANAATAASASAIAAAAGASSAVLGVVAPATITVGNAPTYIGALVLTGGANGTTAGEAVFASGSVSADLALYSATGTRTNYITPAPGGSTPSGLGTTLPTGPTRVNPIYGVALQGIAQVGMPAILQLFGTDALPASAADIAIFSSDGASTPYAQISAWAQ